MINHDDDEIISEINITPLVDIMLVLLIIFMLVSTPVDFSAINVELPKAATGENAEIASIAIVIAKTGEYFVAGNSVQSFDALKKILEENKNSDIQAIISADRHVSHGLLKKPKSNQS